MERNRLRLAEAYLLTDEELRLLQEELKVLEEAALKIAPLFENLASRLDKLQQHTSEERSPLLARRLATLRFQLKTLMQRHGYKAEIFSELQESLRRARRKAPREIVPNRLLQRLNRLSKQGGRSVPQTNLTVPKKTPPSNSLYFIIVKNGTMNFLLPGEEIIWQRRVPNREELTLRLPSKISAEPLLFSSLPGQDPLEPAPVRKLALLVQGRIGRFAVLADAIGGSIRLTPQLFRQKLSFLKVQDSIYEAYLLLHGVRFFIRRNWLAPLQAYLQQSSQPDM